ncbi:phospholipase D delta-like [Pistacia vera]|uniref:phospholipase D delta-like n=1 Tax=Pistacia vera TaxID=55513 RepID=UPI001262EB91|nr:phospholipase D delta-like [Pistacia vera]
MPTTAEDGKDLYLHGDLDLKIIKARRLPNMDIVSEHLRLCFTACRVSESKPESEPHDWVAEEKGDGIEDNHHHSKIITSDPYVTVSVPQATVARTRVIKNSQNPFWNEHFLIPLAHPVADLEFQVKDNDVFGAEIIGKAKIPAHKIATR